MRTNTRQAIHFHKLLGYAAITLVLISGQLFPKYAEALTTEKSPYTKTNYTHADAFDGKNIYHGISVSYKNGNIDWEQVKKAGVEYAFIQAGYRGNHLGKLYKDSKLVKNINGAINAGIKVGITYTTEAVTVGEAQEEANACLSYVKNYKFTLPVMLTFESYEEDTKIESRKKNLSKDKITANCKAFCETVQKAGYTTFLHCTKNDLQTKLNLSELSSLSGICLKELGSKATYTGDYHLWQYSNSGSVKGINGNVNCLFWYSFDDITTSDYQSKYHLINASVSAIPTKSYTGKKITPEITVSIGEKKLVNKTDYTISYSNNKNPGLAYVKIKGSGQYKGTKTISFSIIPSKIKELTVATETKNSIKITWNTVKEATGYEVYRKNYSDGSYQLLKTISDATKHSYTDKTVKTTYAYTYKVKAFTKKNGLKYQGKASTVVGVACATRTGCFLTRKLTVYKKADITQGTKSIAKNTMIISHGIVRRSDGTKFFRITYQKNKKQQTGYLRNVSHITFSLAKVTTAKLSLRTQAGTWNKELTTLPASTEFVVLSQTKKAGVTWYKTMYRKGTKTYTGYLCGAYTK